MRKATRRTSGRSDDSSTHGVHQLLRLALPASRYQPKTKPSRMHRAKPASSSRKPTTALSTREACYLELLKRLCPQVAEVQRLLLSFHTLVAERSPARLDSWLAQCEQSDIAELVRFARGVRRDYAAVRAALCYLWSQGPLEGQVNRLKLLKRQM